MTKTLTEQWRDGELTGGLYYIKTKDGRIFTDGTSYVVGEKMYRWEIVDYHYVAEVLEPVPSYDEWQAELDSNNELLNVQKRLEKKLAIATKALERYSKDDYYSEGGGRSVNPNPDIAHKALKEMEGVK